MFWTNPSSKLSSSAARYRRAPALYAVSSERTSERNEDDVAGGPRRAGSSAPPHPAPEARAGMAPEARVGVAPEARVGTAPEARAGDSRGQTPGSPGGPAVPVGPELMDYLYEAVVPYGNAAMPDSPEVAKLGEDARRRARLATHLCALLPDLERDELVRVHRLALRAVETLAADPVIGVRVCIAATLPTVDWQVPVAVCLTLASDSAAEVATGVLAACPWLDDDILIAALADKPPPWRVQAIAGRRPLSAAVARVVQATRDVGAIAVLLSNPDADLPDDVLTRAVDDAMTSVDWQERLARRPRLPKAVAQRLARFAEDHVMKLLLARRDIDASMLNQSAALPRTDWLKGGVADEPPAQRALRLHKSGQLTEAVLMTAIDHGAESFLRSALALLTGGRTTDVERILAGREPRAITALAWAAGLSARTATQLQLRVARIPASKVLNARDGRDYPLSQAELRAQVDALGLRVAAAA